VVRKALSQRIVRSYFKGSAGHLPRPCFYPSL
jgi:hypothetical protein